MTTAVLKSKGPELLAEISNFVSKAHCFLLPGDKSIFLQTWIREIEKVMKIDAVHGSLLKAKLGEAHGDIEQVDYWLNNAQRLGVKPYQMAVNMLVAYCNLGYGSKALQVFRDHVDISHGNIGDTIWLTPGVGAFKYMKHLMEQAKRGNVELPETNLALSQSVADLLALSDVSDDACAQVIDVAGEVMRKRKIFWLGDMANFVLDHESSSVLMRFSVDASYQEASAMSTEAVELLIDRNLDTLPLMIDFVGTHA